MVDTSVSVEKLISEADLFINSVALQRGWKPNGVVDKLGVQIHDWKLNIQSPIWYNYQPNVKTLKLFIDKPFAHVIAQNKFMLGCLTEHLLHLSSLPVSSLNRFIWVRGGGYRTPPTCDILTHRIQSFLNNSGKYGIASLPSSVGFVNLVNPTITQPTTLVRKSSFVVPPWYKLFSEMVDAGRHIQFMGPPGVGKTFAVDHLAEERGIRLASVNCDGRLNRTHLEGTREVENGSSIFKKAEFADAATDGFWAKLDEANMVDADAIVVLNGVIERPRKINLANKSYDVHKNFRCFLTYNPGLTGTKTLPESLADRFFPIYVSHQDEKFLRAILEVNNVGSKIASVLAKFAIPCWSLYNTKKIRYALSTRRLMDASLMMDKGYSFLESIKFSVFPFVTNPLERTEIEKVMNSVVVSFKP